MVFPSGSDSKESQMVKVLTLSWEDPLEKGMATHSSILAWRVSWTVETDGLQSMGSQRVGHNWVTNTLCFPKAWVLGDCPLLFNFQLVTSVSNNPWVCSVLLWRCLSNLSSVRLVKSNSPLQRRSLSWVHMFYNKRWEVGGINKDEEYGVKASLGPQASQQPMKMSLCSDSPTHGLTEIII